MRRGKAVFGQGSFLLLLASTIWADSAAEAQFKAIYTKEWTFRQSQNSDDNAGDGMGGRRGVNPRLATVSAKTQEARTAYWTDVLAQLGNIDRASLSPPEQINYVVYRSQIQVLLNNQRFREYEKPLNADTAFWSSITGVARRPFRTITDYNNFITQMKDIPRFFDEEIVNMKAGLARKFTPSKVTLIGRDSSIASVAEAKSPEDTIFFAPFKDMPAAIPASEQSELRSEALEAIRNSVVPSYVNLLKFFRSDYIANARTELAAESLPNGKEYYQAKIVEFTTMTLTPAEIHQIGLDEGRKIHAEMLEVMKKTGFGGDFSAFLEFLRTDPQFYAKTPEELLVRAAYIAKQFDAKASQYFGFLPRQRFAILPVPPDQAPFYTSGRGGAGTYLVNTYDLPTRKLYSLPALTLHESAPGHAFQGSINQEHKDVPPFRRVGISAFGEGWGLYCERLGVEMGMYHTPYETFGMLSYQAWRAARLVVDTGIHSKGWTREQAQKYLHENTALADHEIETEVDRYIAWPGQALSYYLGEMEMWKARRKAEAALGMKFNIRAFHDTVLEMGAVPLPVLETRINRFIAEGGKGPYPEME
jgi:uncharacterized protein (DUF885 family)